MTRRAWSKARPGQLFAIEWPEWHFDCPGCGKQVHLVDAGMAYTLPQAEVLGQQSREGIRIKGKWYCPECGRTKGQDHVTP